MTARLLSSVALWIGCAGAGPAAVRFANAPPVEVVDDRRDVPRTPAPRPFARALYHFDGTFARPLDRALALEAPRRALGVNALDEVPDSTWFTNRIGIRALSPDELRTGPSSAGSPEPHRPWTIKSSKVGGISVGFVIEDARGEKYLLKFDPLGFPEAETAADVITSRLLWACGYNVPEDHVVYFRPDDLVLAPDATVKDTFGNKSRLDAAGLAARLAQVEHEPDGRIRGLASRILDGTWLGGHPGEGVRGDDPNDRIPHELRRDLRGARAIFAWLDHADAKEDNTLDMWVEDPALPGRHYVKHYLLDFGKSLGFMAAEATDPRRGYAYVIDWGEMLASLVSVGLHPRAWESRTGPRLRGVGLYETSSFDPARWKPYTMSYAPFLAADRIDQFWGAKILIRFTRAQLQAVVETARLSDPRASAYLVDALVARQRATARHWFAQVNPLDRFRLIPTVRGHALCFEDLAIAHAFTTADATRYALTLANDRGERFHDRVEVTPSAGGHACTPPLPLGDGEDGYTIVRIETERGGRRLATQVHLARAPGSAIPRVIGVWRL